MFSYFHSQNIALILRSWSEMLRAISSYWFAQCSTLAEVSITVNSNNSMFVRKRNHLNGVHALWKMIKKSWSHKPENYKLRLAIFDLLSMFWEILYNPPGLVSNFIP